ncbi:uncharacterized protein LOC130946193 [Arachis stenosperma]|uniref:uncharacterized protein LOC130946193 n=1 Tax=Arachis stenosperma TaxID=217475 RepID=UPI0025ABA2CB|nr:uncharacterized protein LOC130946193 [Arachis stenosperma]
MTLRSIKLWDLRIKSNASRILHCKPTPPPQGGGILLPSVALKVRHPSSSFPRAPSLQPLFAVTERGCFLELGVRRLCLLSHASVAVCLPFTFASSFAFARRSPFAFTRCSPFEFAFVWKPRCSASNSATNPRAPLVELLSVVPADQDCYELSAEYERKHKTEKLEELGNMLTGLDAGDSIVIAKSFSHMLNLANLAEEVQIAYRRRIKLLKKGDFADENSAITESDIEETFKRLVTELKKSPQEVFDALKKQTVDLVLTAHPTQSVRRSLLQKHGRAGRIP